MNDPETPLLVRALRGEATPRRPVWLMRQAGRYLPGYQKVRSQVGFLELCRRPDLATEVSLEPVERFGVDAAIVFSDILIPLEALGVEVRFDDRGPVVPEPVRDAERIGAIGELDPREGTPWILDTIAALADALPAATPVIGFAGAPFTLATYAVEGRVTKSLTHVSGLRWRDPHAFRTLLGRLACATVPYLAEQARSGARALQLFDTWAGMLGREAWREFELPVVKAIFEGVREELGSACPPLVYFSKGTSAWLEELPATGADAYSVDWTLPLGEAKMRLGDRPVQGNLDPTALHGTPDAVREATLAMLADVEGRDGVVANLGHGVIVGTPPENVAAFVDTVKSA